MTDGERLSRRAFLGAGGAVLASSLGGCTRSPADRITRGGPIPPSAVIPPQTATPDPATSVYVAPDGRSGAPGTRNRPLDSLSDALTIVDPGETIVLRGGTYRPRKTVGARGVSGAEGEPIRIVPAAGERPIFDFRRAKTGGFRFSACEWLDLLGVEIRNAPSRGLFVEDGSRQITVDSVTVRDSGGDPDASGAGVFVLDAEAVTLRNAVVSGSYDPSSGGRNADGIAVEDASVTLVESCVAAYNSDDGFDLWQTTDVTLRRCRAFGNGWTPDGSASGDGDGFKLGGGDDSGDNRAERCVAFNNRVRGFDDNSAARPLTLSHCTAWHNPINFRIGCQVDVGDLPKCPPHRLRNNLSHDGLTVFSPLVDSAHNSWDLDVRDPQFASLDPTAPDFLHLTADSPAVDAGVDIGLPYSGSQPDLGAFEYTPPE